MKCFRRPAPHSYESQLSPPQRARLLDLLLDPTLTLAEIQNEAPPWREGPKKGKRPTLTTLDALFERAQFEEQERRNDQEVERFKSELKTDCPSLTPEEINRRGDQFFRVQIMRQQDRVSWIRLRKLDLQEKQIENEARKVALAEAKAKIDETLDEQRDKGAISEEVKREIIEAIHKRLMGA